MITEAILRLFMGVISVLLNLLPAIDWSVPNAVLDVFLDILENVAYFLPMDTVIAILSLIISINLFKIGVAVVKTILKFIPKL